MLALGDIPLIYFLTDTRPAFYFTWQPAHWNGGVALRQAMLDDMLARQRTPRYCVIGRMPGFRPTDPIHRFVLSHYRPIAHHGLFELWGR